MDHLEAGMAPIPHDLTIFDRWCTWTLTPGPTGRLTKKPSGSTLLPATQRPFSEVAHVPLTPHSGVGFIFTGGVTWQGKTLVAFDLDAAHFDHQPTPWAAEIIDHYNTYTEVSPSGHGYRLFLWLRNTPPQSIGKVRVPADSPIDKAPEIQVFGTGPAGYVTVTGKSLHNHTTDVATVDDLTWFIERYRAQLTAATPTKLPDGTGPTPSVSIIRERMERQPEIAALIKGNWESIPSLPSASEGWYRLIVAALKAANYHGDAALAFVREHTAYGHGLVESKDPSRYMRADWQTRDFARIAGKADQAAVFRDDFDAASWRPLRPVDVESWLLPHRDYRKAVAEQSYLLEGLMPSHGLVQFFGDAGCGKTAVVLSIAAHVATGRDWLDFELDRPGRVVYVTGEGFFGISKRLDALAQTLDEDPDALPIYISTRRASLLDAGNVQAWLDQIERALKDDEEHDGPAVMLVVDTVAANFGAGDENSTEDMTQFIDRVQKLGARLKVCTVLVHHTGRGDKTRGRGSSALDGALDGNYEVSKQGTTVKIVCKKAKDWEPPEPIHGQLRGIELGVDDKGRTVSGVVFGELAHADFFADMVCPDSFPGEPIDETEARILRGLDDRIGPASQQDLTSDLSIPERTIRRKLNTLEEKGYVQAEGATRGRRYSVLQFGLDAVRAFFG